MSWEFSFEIFIIIFFIFVFVLNNFSFLTINNSEELHKLNFFHAASIQETQIWCQNKCYHEINLGADVR